MPKLKMSDYELKKAEFQAILKKNMMLCGYERQQDVAPLIGICRETFNYKYNDPNKFTLRELRRIFTKLKYTDEDKLRVM